MSYEIWRENGFSFYTLGKRIFVRYRNSDLWEGKIDTLQEGDQPTIKKVLYSDTYLCEGMYGVKVYNNDEEDLYKVQDDIREESFLETIWDKLKSLSQKVKAYKAEEIEAQTEESRLVKILKEQPQLFDLVKKVDLEQEKSRKLQMKFEKAQKEAESDRERAKTLLEENKKLIKEKEALERSLKAYKETERTFKADLLEKVRKVLQ